MPPQVSPPDVGPAEPTQRLPAGLGLSRDLSSNGHRATRKARPIQSTEKQKPVARTPGRQRGHAVLSETVAQRGAAGKAAERGQIPDQTKLLITGLYVALRTINGAGLTAFTSSRLALTRLGGVDEAEFNPAVGLSKVGKIVGTVLFLAHGELIGRKIGPSPHVVLAAMTAVVAVAMFLIPSIQSAEIMNYAMLFFGLGYGYTNASYGSFLQWIWVGNPDMTRAAVTWCSAFFTLGASVTPFTVSLGLEYLETPACTFQVLSLLAALSAIIGVMLPSPVPPSKDDPTAARSNGPGAQSVASKSKSELEWTLTWCTGLTLFMVVGTEHAISTWIPTFAQAKIGLSESAAAALSGTFWTAIAVGRWAYTVASASGSNNWNATLGMLSIAVCSGIMLLTGAQELLWFAVIGFGLGFSALYPVVFTLAASEGVVLPPRILTTIILFYNAGEASITQAVGELMSRYGAECLPCVLIVLTVTTFVVVAMAYARVKTLQASAAKND